MRAASSRRSMPITSRPRIWRRWWHRIGMKILGDPNNPARFRNDATADEVRAEIMQRLRILVSAGLIDLKALPVPDGGIANKSIPGVDQSRINGE
jgi:hypothetical protein